MKSFRHRPFQIEPKELAVEKNPLGNPLVYLPLTDFLPDATRFISPNLTSARFTASDTYTVTANINVTDFSFFVWVLPDQILENNILSFGDKFFLYIEAGILKIKREVKPGSFEVTSLRLTLLQNAWQLIRLSRKDNRLTCKVGDTTSEIDFFYKCKGTNFILGGNFEGNLFNVFFDTADIPFLLAAPTSGFNQIFADKTLEKTQIAYVEKKLFSVKGQGVIGNFFLDYVFTLADLEVDTEILVCKGSFTMRYKSSGKEITFNNQSLIQNLTSGLLAIRVRVEGALATIWLNGFQTATINLTAPPTSYTFDSTSTNITPFFFSTEKYDTLSFFNYLPSTSKENNLGFSKFYPIRQRLESQVNTQLLIEDLTLMPIQPVTPNSITNFVLMSQNLSEFARTFTVSFEFPLLSDWVSSEITAPLTVTIPIGQDMVNFSLVTSNFAVKLNRTNFNLRIGGFVFQVSFQDNRIYALSANIPSSGLLTGYFATDSTVSGVLPNITNTAPSATTSAILTNSPLFGECYFVANETEKILLNRTVNTVRHILFFYKELGLVSKRRYLNDAFNGGENGELVGNLELPPDTYLKIFTRSGRAPIVSVAPDEQNIAWLEEDSGTLQLLSKNISGKWAEPVILTLPARTSLVNASLSWSSTTLVIGAKNSKSGEGLVLEYLRNTGTLSLSLGSPVPTPYVGGFGQWVIIDSEENLVVSEQGSSNVYVFEKVLGIYNTTPIQILPGVESRKITGFSGGFVCLGNSGTAKVVENYAQVKTIDANFDIACSSTYIFSSRLDNTIDIWQKSVGVWVLLTTVQKPVAASALFGYSISANAAGDLLVGDPTQSKVYLFLAANNWADSQIFETGGYSVSLTTNNILTSNYAAAIELYSKDTSVFDKIITAVRQDGVLVTDQTLLQTNDVALLSFVTAANLSVNEICTKLNGLFFGVLFYNRVLTSNEITSINRTVKDYCRLKEYGRF